MNDTGTMSAEMRATRTPNPYAASASASMAARSRSAAPAARMVRIEPIARSTAAARSPTFSCARATAGLIRIDSSTTTTSETAMMPKVTRNRKGSMTSMPMSAPTNSSAPPTASTSPCVSTARSSVVSLPTRETRSPVRRRSNSGMGRCRILAMSRRRELSTTSSPMRCSR